MKRHLLALGASAVLLAGGANAALGSGASAPPAAPNSASQSASNSQILPIAAGVGAAVPVNANVPVAVLSAGPSQGAVTQRGDAKASGEALNNETDQSIRQSGAGGGNSASQSASNSQILPIAAAIGAAVPVNANVPVAVLSGGPAQGDVSQRGNARAGAEALNNETEQTIRQDGAKGAGGSSASQSASNSQILPIALGAALGIPVNANVPIAVLSGGPVQGDVSQRGDANARARAVNVEHDQDINQSGAKGAGGNSASQSASNSQILPIALGLGAAVPVNLNLPIAILSGGPVQGGVSQQGDAKADAEALNNETEQTIRQDGTATQRQSQGASASQSASASQVIPVALGAGAAAPVNANLPIAILSGGDGPVPLGLVHAVLETVKATLADPVGTVVAVLKDPVGSITGLLASL